MVGKQENLSSRKWVSCFIKHQKFTASFNSSYHFQGSGGTCGVFSASKLSQIIKKLIMNTILENKQATIWINVPLVCLLNNCFWILNDS